MKTRNIWMTLTGLLLLSCQAGNRIETEVRQADERTTEWVIQTSCHTFSSKNPGLADACRKLNMTLTARLDGITTAFKEKSRRRQKELEGTGSPVHPFELVVKDSIFHNDGRTVSLLVTSYGMTGGANGEYRLLATNYDLDSGRAMSRIELLEMGREAEINALLESHLPTAVKPLIFELPTARNASAVNFTDKAVVFTYNKYILGPGSCGLITISVPKDEMDGLFKVR